MKVVVCVESWGLGEASRAALTLAAGLRPAATVIALSSTDTDAAEALSEAQRLGAQRVAQVMELSLEGLDAGALGKTLAEALRLLGADLVLCGARSDGEGRGIVPAAIAHHLGAPYLSHVEALSAVSETEITALVRAGGRKRTLAVALPAVLSVGAAIAATAAPRPAPASAIEVLKLDAGMRTVGRASDLGTLDRPRRKPAAASSAGDLLRRWSE